MKLTSDFSTSAKKGKALRFDLKNVRTNAMEDMTKLYNDGIGLDGESSLKWGWGSWSNRTYGLGTGCIHHARKALLRAGIPILPLINPITLPVELYIRQIGGYAAPFLSN